MRGVSTVFTTGMRYLWSKPLDVAIIALLPILLILLLGTALSTYISPETEIEPISIACVTDNHKSLFSEFLKSEEIARFLITEFTTDEKANELLTENEITLFVTEKNGVISVTKSNVSSMNTSVALSIIDSYNNISTAAKIAIEAGANPVEVMADIQSEFAVTAKPLGNRVPTATDYYAVTILVYMLLIAGLNGLDLFNKSLLGDMGGRIMTAPVSKPALVGGLIASATVMSFLQGMVPFIFTALFYGVYWGGIGSILLVLVTLFAIVLLSQAIALFLLLLFKNPGPAMGIMQAFFWVSTFVSKGYAKISFGESAEKIFAYAPNALAHATIFGAIYGGNESKMYSSLAILFVAAFVFFVAAFLLGRRRFA